MGVLAFAIVLEIATYPIVMHLEVFYLCTL